MIENIEEEEGDLGLKALIVHSSLRTLITQVAVTEKVDGTIGVATAIEEASKDHPLPRHLDIITIAAIDTREAEEMTMILLTEDIITIINLLEEKMGNTNITERIVNDFFVKV